VSLQFTVANSLDRNKKNKGGVQFVSQSTAKLTMDLIFDTTHTGLDVRISTDQIAKLYFPYEKQDQDGDDGSASPRSSNSLGAYKFKASRAVHGNRSISSPEACRCGQASISPFRKQYRVQEQQESRRHADRKKGPGPVWCPTT